MSVMAKLLFFQMIALVAIGTCFTLTSIESQRQADEITVTSSGYIQCEPGQTDEITVYSSGYIQAVAVTSNPYIPTS